MRVPRRGSNPAPFLEDFRLQSLSIHVMASNKAEGKLQKGSSGMPESHRSWDTEDPPLATNSQVCRRTFSLRGSEAGPRMGRGLTREAPGHISPSRQGLTPFPRTALRKQFVRDFQMLLVRRKKCPSPDDLPVGAIQLTTSPELQDIT